MGCIATKDKKAVGGTEYELVQIVDIESEV